MNLPKTPRKKIKKSRKSKTTRKLHLKTKKKVKEKEWVKESQIKERKLHMPRLSRLRKMILNVCTVRKKIPAITRVKGGLNVVHVENGVMKLVLG